MLCLQRLQEMRSEEAQRTKGSRDRKERKRQDREAARLAAQYAFSGFNIVLEGQSSDIQQQ